MKAIIPIWLAAILFVGCSDRPVIKDNSAVVVYPGLGISNVCAVGMTFEQIRKATGDARLMIGEPWSFKRLNPWRKKDYYISIPSLGATTAYLTANRPWAASFDVSTNKANKVAFRGKLGDKLSFKDGPVSRAQVEAAFGAVTTNFGLTNYPSIIPPTKDPYLFKVNEDWFQLNYPSQGLSFMFLSNSVSRIYINGIRNDEK